MLTLENIKSEFTFIDAFTDDSECYQNSETFEGYGDFCDVYFVSLNKNIRQEQIDVYNKFKQNFKDYLPKIEQKIQSSLSNSELSKEDEIKNSILYFEIIQIPQSNRKYDLVLVCSKTYKKLIFFRQTITLRVEFKNENIISIKRTTDSTKDNDE